MLQQHKDSKSSVQHTTRATLLAALLLLPAVANAGQYRWTQHSPEPPLLDKIVPDPANSAEAWILSARTLYRAFQSGEPWRALRRDVREFHRHALTGRLYALDSTGLVASSDGGVTWTPLPLPEEGAASFPSGHSGVLGVTAQNPPTLYLAYGMGLHRSRNEGASWQPVLYEPGLPVRRLEVAEDAAGTVYAILGGSGQLHPYRSTDGGTTWIRGGPLPVCPPTVGCPSEPSIEASPHNPNLVFARSAIVFFRSVDGGMSWTLLPGPLGNGTTVAFDPIDPQRILVGTGYGSKFYESADAGATWNPLDTGLHFDGDGVSTLTFGPIGEIHAGLARGGNGRWVRSNGTSSWSVLPTSGVSGGHAMSVATHPSNAETLWGAGLFALHRSEDRGLSWEPLAEIRLLGIRVDRTHPQRLYARRWTEVDLVRSVDGGRTWALSLDVRGVIGLEISPSDSSILYAWTGGDPAVFYRSADAGSTWSNQGETPGDIPLQGIAVDPLNPNRIFAATLEGLHRSEDGGASWEVQGGVLDPQENFYSILYDAVDRTTVYALSESPWGLAVSRDSGASWNRHPGSGSWDIKLRADPAVAGSVYLFHGQFFGTIRDYGERGYPLSRLGMPMFSYPFLLEDASVSADGRTLYTATSDPWGAPGLWVFDRLYDDVPLLDPHYQLVDAIAFSGISAGCAPDLFCPEAILTRGQAAVLIVGSTFQQFSFPPTGTVFSDVGPSTLGAVQIEWLGTGGYSSGCGGGRFCPDEPFTRAQTAVLTLAVRDGPWNPPPPATGTMFADVPTSHFAAAWIEEFARQGYTAGCAPNLFCPEQAVTRAHMAVFLAGVFDLW
jgi:photosystem II stability/assembly factor-like uncharacterized protein